MVVVNLVLVELDVEVIGPDGQRATNLTNSSPLHANGGDIGTTV